MTKNRVKETVELVAVFSIVASLIFVGLQVKQEREVARTEAVVAAAESRKYMAELISENRKIWVSGLAGEPLADIDNVAFESLADAHYMDVFAKWYRASELGHTSPDRFPFQYARFLIENPGLLAYWHEQAAREFELRELRGIASRNRGGWNGAVENALKKLQEHGVMED